MMHVRPTLMLTGWLGYNSVMEAEITVDHGEDST